MSLLRNRYLPLAHPLVPLAVCLGLGIVVGYYFKLPLAGLWGLTGTTFFLCLFCLKKPRLASSILAVGFLIAGCLIMRIEENAFDVYTQTLQGWQEREVTLVGTVISEPITRTKKISLLLQLEKVIINNKELPIGKKVIVWWFRGKEQVPLSMGYGQRLLMEGVFRKIPAWHAGTSQYQAYLRHQGILGVLYVKKDSRVVSLKQGAGNLLSSSAFRVRKWLKTRFQGLEDPVSRDFLSAVLLGEQQSFPKALRQLFSQTGTAHILAISGLNVGLVSLVVLFVLRLFRCPWRLLYSILILFLIFYCLLTGSQPSVVRATIMAVVYVLGFLLERQVRSLNTLALAFLVILVFQPAQLFDIGFQLSFLSVWAIMWLFPEIWRWLPKGLKRQRLSRYLLTSLIISLAASLVTTGIIAYHFGIVSLIAPLANIVIIPLTFVITCWGFLFLLVSFILPSVSQLVATSLEFSVWLLVLITKSFADIPFAFLRVPPFPLWVLVLVYLALGAIWFVINKIRQQDVRVRPCQN